jgi:hypothetical protein
MTCDRNAIIDLLRKEALARCKKRIEEAAAGEQDGMKWKTYARQDHGLMTAYKRARGL